ncbi:hypothetical protein BYT27DRAFT_7181612 [Phlegmacium glaucopus]|nr:hypothetical protein BYT27DRAFT_7181612 [Phlegmacium glaucopus]
MTEDDIKLLLKDGQSLNSPEQQESVARNVDVEVLNAWEAAKELRSLADIRRLESVDQQRESRLDDFLYAWRESVTTMQESLNSLNTQLADGVEAKITNLVNLLMRKTGGVLEHLGVSFEWPSDTRRSLLTRKDIMYYEIQGDILGPPTPEKTWEARAAFDMDNKWIMPRLLPPRLLVSDLLIYAHPTGHPLARYYMNSSKFKLPKLPRLDSNSPDLAAKILDIPEIDQLITQPMGARHYPQPFEDQLWRLRDLNDGGTGFLIELFFATFGSLEQTALTDESKQLIKATLHAITHDEETSKGLQKPACQKCLTALREELEEKLFKWHLPESAPQSTPNFVIDILLKLIDDTTDKVEEYVEPTSAEDSLGKEDKDKGWGDSQLKQRSEPRWLAWKESERPSENGKDLGRAKAKSKILSKPRSLSTGSGVVYVHGGPRAGQRRYKIRPATVQIRPAAVHIRPLAVQDTATVHTQRIDSVDEFT